MRFEFIPLWGFLVSLLYTMRQVDCCRCGVGLHTLTAGKEAERTIAS
jgi:transposase